MKKSNKPMNIIQLNDIRHKHIKREIADTNSKLTKAQQYLKELEAALTTEIQPPKALTQAQYNCPTFHHNLCHYCMATCDYDRTDTNYFDQDNQDMCSSCFQLFHEEYDTPITYKDVICTICHDKTVEKVHYVKSYDEFIQKKYVLTKPMCNDCFESVVKECAI